MEIAINLSSVVYVLMLGFQLAGTLILIQDSWKCGEKTILRHCFQGTNFIKADENNRYVMPKEKLQDSAYSLYLNRASFIDLFIGCCLGICNIYSTQILVKSYLTIIGVLIVCILLSVLESLICRKIAKCKYREDHEITEDEINDLEDVCKIDIIMPIKNDEIDSLLDDKHNE